MLLTRQKDSVINARILFLDGTQPSPLRQRPLYFVWTLASEECFDHEQEEGFTKVTTVICLRGRLHATELSTPIQTSFGGK
jgi:hypothetical protein